MEMNKHFENKIFIDKILFKRDKAWHYKYNRRKDQGKTTQKWLCYQTLSRWVCQCVIQRILPEKAPTRQGHKLLQKTMKCSFHFQKSFTYEHSLVTLKLRAPPQVLDASYDVPATRSSKEKKK